MTPPPNPQALQRTRLRVSLTGRQPNCWHWTFVGLFCAAAVFFSAAGALCQAPVADKTSLKTYLPDETPTVSDLLRGLQSSHIRVAYEMSSLVDTDSWEEPLRLSRPIKSISDIVSIISGKTGQRTFFSNGVLTVQEPLITKRLGRDPLDITVPSVELHDASVYEALTTLSKATGYRISPGIMSRTTMTQRITISATQLTLRAILLEMASKFGNRGYQVNVMFLEKDVYPLPVKMDVAL